MTGPLNDQQLDEIEARALRASTYADYHRIAGRDVPDLVAEIRRLRIDLAVAIHQRDTLKAGFEEVQAARSELRAELGDAAGYLAVMHRHANRHDVLGAGCALLERIEGDAHPATASDPAARHFSPGYQGEIPDHLGAFEVCPMPACATARAQHEAAADIQDLTYEALASRDGAAP